MDITHATLLSIFLWTHSFYFLSCNTPLFLNNSSVISGDLLRFRTLLTRRQHRLRLSGWAGWMKDLLHVVLLKGNRNNFLSILLLKYCHFRWNIVQILKCFSLQHGFSTSDGWPLSTWHDLKTFSSILVQNLMCWLNKSPFPEYKKLTLKHLSSFNM